MFELSARKSCEERTSDKFNKITKFNVACSSHIEDELAGAARESEDEMVARMGVKARTDDAI